MSGVKWVHHDNLRPCHNRIDSVPVLTLDQIEAWLKENEYWRTAHGLHVCLDDLLAQVQAWKEKK